MAKLTALEPLLGKFDRAAHRRRDSGWLSDQLKAPAWFVPFWKGQNFFTKQGDRPPLAICVEAQAVDQVPIVFLGTHADDQALFALDLSARAETQGEALARLQVTESSAFFVNLRSYQGQLTPEERGLLFYVRALMHWHASQRFCHVCSWPTRPEEGGHVMVCTNEPCKTQIFPRSDPATIMLVHKDGRCLLGRQPSWPEGIYSTLAGFVEAGETVEQAVVREVKEETGIDVTNLRYFGSQPWPFPQSLMLGFHAEAINTEIVCGPELAEVRWFDVDEANALMTRLNLRYPHLDTIARRLIRAWLGHVTGSG
jgi:NAD+ diphosphatase